MLKPGPRNLITGVDGILVGNAEDQRVRSGVSVVLCDPPATASVDVRGGAPGDLLCKVVVETPVNLSDEQKEKVKAAQKSMQEKMQEVRSGTGSPEEKKAAEPRALGALLFGKPCPAGTVSGAEANAR